MASLSEELRTFIAGNITYSDDINALSDDASLLSHGLIDSTGVLELIAYIERRFGFSVEAEELVPENLDSVGGLVRYIERKNNQGGTFPND